MGVAPHRVVALAALERAALHGIAVREQHRGLAAVGLDAHRIGGEHVRTVQEVGDAAEALRLALRAVDAARQVESRQRLVGLRIAIGDGLERERFLGQAGDDELGIGALEFARAELAAVEAHGLQFDHLAVEPQWPRVARIGRVALDLEPRPHPRARRVQRHVEVDRIDQIVGRLVILEQYRPRRVGLHFRCSGASGSAGELRTWPSLFRCSSKS